MGLLQLLRKLKRSDSEARILVLGLDNAGKTTILKKMGDENADNVMPTQGFNIKTLVKEGFKLNMWDIGGQQSIRPYWKNYYKNTDALVFVVDSSDEARMDEAVSVLDDLLHKEDDLAGKPVLLLGNKQDLLNAMDMEALIEIFSDTIGSATFAVHGVSAVSGEGLQAAFEELVRLLNNDTAAGAGAAAASTDTAAAAGGTGGDK